ncbi:MAG: O-antigen ligase family protein [Actinobacteria bacterium]|nr:O-antigen ligase family protein [Actinomycetota bacterium]
MGGLAVVLHPTLSIGLVLTAALLGVLAVVPLYFFAPAVLAGTVVIPLFLLESHARGLSLASTPLAGQGRLLLLLAAVCLTRVVLERRIIKLPSLETAAVSLYALGLLVSLAVASTRQNWYSGIVSDLARQLTYPLAFVVGVVASRSASTTAGRLSLYRATACVGIGACSLSTLWWAWEKGHLPIRIPLLTTLFEHSLAASVYASGRSTFPFTDDSPNTSAVVFVLLAISTIPMLLSSEARRDNWIGFVMIAAVTAGVLTTQSRTGLVALAAAGLPLLLGAYTGIRRRPLVVAIVLLLVIASAGYRAFPHNRKLTTQTATYAVRKTIWHEAIPKFLDAPLLGQGYHYSARPNFITAAVNPAAVGGASGGLQSVHSEYLGQLVDGGIVGGLIFLLVLTAFVRVALKCMGSKFKIFRAEGTGFLGVISGLAVAMYAAAVFQSAVATITVWLLFGVLAERGDYLERQRPSA